MTKLSAELESLRKIVEEFVYDVVAPEIGDFYEWDAFFYDIVRQMGQMGLFGLLFLEEYGGMGGDYFALCIAIEELARVDSSVAIILEAVVSLGAMLFFCFGIEEQKRTWLLLFCFGESFGAFGLIEPGVGFDAGGTLTIVRFDGDEWVINGTKVFIINSGIDIIVFVIVTVVIGEIDEGRKEISLIIVFFGTPGFMVSKKYFKVGWNVFDTRELSFFDVWVSRANLLGECGRGYVQFLLILDEGRIAIAVLGIGFAQGCFDESVCYVRTRIAFGKLIGDNQAVVFKIADMEVWVYIVRFAYYDAVGWMLCGESFKRQAVIAKFYFLEIAVINVREVIQIHGGYGFMNEIPVARMWRDSKVLEIGEGIFEVQRIFIVRDFGV